MATDQATKRATKPALVKATMLSKSFVQRGGLFRKKLSIQAIKNVDLEILPLCVTALVGESGSGKSTLASCLALLEKPDAGTIWFQGREISSWAARDLAPLRPKIQMVFQDSAEALNPRFTAAEIIEEPLEIQQRKHGRQPRSRACELMEEVGLSADWANRHPSQLSGGQRQRLAIARAVALQPDFLILDESLSGLDLTTQAQILLLLLDLQQSHSLTYLLISHDLSLVGQVADYIAVMQGGQVVEYGTRQEVLSSPRHEHTRALLTSAQTLEAAFEDVEAAVQV